MNVQLYYDNELRINFRKDSDELLALVKALKDLKEIMEKKTNLSREHLLTVITNYDYNDPSSLRSFTYDINDFKDNLESLTEIRNLIKRYSDDLNTNA